MANVLVFIFILISGIFFRFVNLSPFKFYPDAYQNLLVAQNIRIYHNVVGYLGQGGMLFPEFFMWSRPGYPLLINFFTKFGAQDTQTAQLLAFAFGILAIPLAYIYIKRVFGTTLPAMAAALLLAFSYNHTVWSGFIMTETTGVFFMLLFLLSLFSSIKDEAKLASTHDAVTGMLLAMAIFSRYEYAIVIFPILFLVSRASPRPIPRMITILVSCFFTGAIFLSLLYPIQSLFSVVIDQGKDLLIRGGIMVCFFFFAYIAVKYILLRNRSKFINTALRFVQGSIIVFISFLLLQMLFPEQIPFFSHDLKFLRDFLFHDALISFFSVTGLLVMLGKKTLQTYAIFVLLSCMALSYLYHGINPEMERYITHLLPFLLIPASYSVFWMARIPKSRTIAKSMMTGAIVALVLQGYLTYNGIRNQHGKEWFRTSYEEKAATLVKKYMPPGNPLLIASFPEAYYYFTRIPTQSIANEYPYVFIDDSPDTRPVVIIADMGMRDLFPDFEKVLEKNLRSEKKAMFWVGEPYHYSNRTKKETYPVTIYETTLGNLKHLTRRVRM